VNYFSPAFLEICRKARRQTLRLRLRSEKGKLSRAEAELGLLGWQQAEFRGESQREVEKIKNCEVEQSRLTNEGAACGRSMRKLREEREVLKREFEENKRQSTQQRQELLEPSIRLEKQLEELRKEEPLYERRIPDLDRELREVQGLYSRLYAIKEQTPQDRDDLLRLRERTVAIPNEKAELRTKHMHVASEIKTLESQLSIKRGQLEEVMQKLTSLDESFTTRERQLSGELRVLEKEKLRIDKENDALELAKTNPYQQLGRVLADHGMAPVNQPHALEKVLRFRESVEHLGGEIAASRSLSAEVSPAIVRVSYLVLSAFVFTLVLVLTALLSFF
jgi:chromosome segregation ATPase